ncbi:hypothetical protein BH09PSE6_BH09PSE6_27260 [soil metagenome]
MLVERDHLMLDAAFSTGPTVPSPCISVCRIEAASGLCEGCLRTLDEIVDWSALDGDERRAVWQLLPARFDRLAADRPGPAP